MSSFEVDSTTLCDERLSTGDRFTGGEPSTRNNVSGCVHELKLGKLAAVEE
jgi:hypothetical protein